MASITAAGSSYLMLSAAGCDRASSPFSSSSSLPALCPSRFKNPSNTPLFRLASDGRGSRCLRRRPGEISRGGGGGVGVRASSRRDDNRDDAGVVKDMELYLDDLSLEYDSVWDTKPAWCQPWTIVGTGVGAITASWLPFHNVFLTGGVAVVIGLWWFAFLYAYPLGYSEMIAERRKMVENGSEDTYGRKIGE